MQRYLAEYAFLDGRWHSSVGLDIDDHGQFAAVIRRT
jgi:hypothetical protein